MNHRRIESIIQAYKILRQNYPDYWTIDCSNANSIEQAIELAGKARNFAMKKHSHQFRIPNSILESFANKILESANTVEKSRSFDELISIIGDCKVKGISDLTIYDTAQRIGAFLDQYPDKVYLHRGTRIGAEILLGKVKKAYLTIDELPEPFQTNDLTASEIEDILCIYKERLKMCVT